jgi:hypothetical protein
MVGKNTSSSLVLKLYLIIQNTDHLNWKKVLIWIPETIIKGGETEKPNE